MPSMSDLRARRALTLTAATLLAVTGATFAPAVLAAEPAASFTTQPGGNHAAGRPGDPRAVDDEILIRYVPGTTARERAALNREQGLTHVRTSHNGRTEVVTANGRSVATVRRHLATEPAVEAVAPNHRRELADDISTEPDFGLLWGLHNTGQTIFGGTIQTGIADVDIDALQAIKLEAGSPDVVVGVVDDGIDTAHIDLADRIWTNPGEAGAKATNGIDDDKNGYVDDVHGWDFCNNDNTVHDQGQDGHGTHVAGTIAASRNGRGVVGVAPGVRLMALKFIDDGVFCGTDDQVVEAIDYAASFGVPVINASWGGPDDSAVLDAAIKDSGALVVAAAGNNGWNLDALGSQRFYPASAPLPNIIAVGAIDQTGKRASFSDYGTTTVDIAAPGTNILSTWPPESDCLAPCYAWLDGTSMAAPHVTGVAALAASADPALRTDPIALRQRLLSTGKALAGGTTWTASGKLVDAYRAVDPVPPVAQAPNGFAIAVGSAISSTVTPVAVSWPAATDARTSVSSYTLKRRGPTGWSTVITDSKWRVASSRMAFGSSYVFRLTAKDAPGNTSAAADTPALVATLYSDATAMATYSSGWRTLSSSAAFGGKVHSSTTSGASVTLAFTGRTIAVVAPRGPTRGSIKVYLDGVLNKTVDLYRSTSQDRVVVYSAGWRSKAAHHVKIVVSGTKRVDLDGFIVIR